MTDLEQLRESLRAEYTWAVEIIDAHLKEDAERDEELHQAKTEWFEQRKRTEEFDALRYGEAAKVKALMAELTELREQGGLLTEQVMHMDNRYTELREAVRDVMEFKWSDRSVHEARWNRLRQLIEGKG